MNAQNKRPRDYGIEIGVLKPGKLNAITDVEGVTVGHETIIEGDHVRTGVTAIVPHQGNIFQNKVPAAIYIGNGFGKLAGYSQVKELGNIETPIILTNTLSVAPATATGITIKLIIGINVINITIEPNPNDKTLFSANFSLMCLKAIPWLPMGKSAYSNVYTQPV